MIMQNVDYAKELLVGEKTCILVKDNVIYESQERGITPIMTFINNKLDLRGFSVADKIVGKAAAFLFVYCGIKEVYAEVISKKGIEILEKYRIPYTYSTLTDVIINRKGDDICPMEKTVQDIDDPDAAYKALNETIRSLQ